MSNFVWVTPPNDTCQNLFIVNLDRVTTIFRNASTGITHICFSEREHDYVTCKETLNEIASWVKE